MSRIVLEIRPMSRLTNLRIWAAHYLLPKGWVVTTVPPLDPEAIRRQVEDLRAELRRGARG